MQELPEVTAISEDSQNYLRHLDESLRFLYDRLEDLAERLKKANAPQPMLCNPWLGGGIEVQREDPAELDRMLQETGAKVLEFVEAGLYYVNIDCVYDPGVASRYAKVFFERSDSSMNYVQIDFTTQELISLEKPPVESRKDLLCRKGIEKVLESGEEQPIFIVSTQLRQMPYDALRYHAAAEIHIQMEDKFPDFYAQLQAEHAVDASVFDFECTGSITINGEPVIEMTVVSTFEIDYEDISGPFREGDPRMN